MVFSSSTICNVSGAVVVEKIGDASKESKDAKTFFRAVRLSRRIIDNYSYHGDIETRLVLHFHSVSVKQILPSKMKFIIVEEVYIPTYYQFTF